MRIAIVMSLLGASALALSACSKKTETAAATGDAAPAVASAPAAPFAPPKRKAGLWAQTIDTAGMKQVVKMCLDNDTDAKMSLWGQDMAQSQCAKSTMAPTPGGMKFESVCDMGAAGHIVSTGTATGDFNSRYVVKVSSTTTGAQMAQANGSHEMSLEAAYEGPCPAGMKGGDINVNGMVINVEKMAAMKK